MMHASQEGPKQKLQPHDCLGHFRGVGGGKKWGDLWGRNSDLIKLKELGRVFFEVFAQNRQLLVAMLV